VRARVRACVCVRVRACVRACARAQACKNTWHQTPSSPYSLHPATPGPIRGNQAARPTCVAVSAIEWRICGLWDASRALSSPPRSLGQVLCLVTVGGGCSSARSAAEEEKPGAHPLCLRRRRWQGRWWRRQWRRRRRRWWLR
jgi:hypothetical protein